VRSFVKRLVLEPAAKPYAAPSMRDS